MRLEEYEKMKKKVNIAAMIKDALEHYDQATWSKLAYEYGRGFDCYDTRYKCRLSLNIECWIAEGRTYSLAEKILNIGGEDIFTKTLMCVLNKHFDELLSETANLLLSEASADKERAEEELKEALRALQEL